MAEEDIPDLTRAMTRAFDDDTSKNLGIERGGPDGYDDGRFFRKWVFSYRESRGHKITLGDAIVGGFVVWIYRHRPNVLGTIFVDPSYQDQGIGGRAWDFIEATYPTARGWQLETPSYAVKNLHFYEQRCGFRKTKAVATDEHAGTSLIYEKRATNPAARSRSTGEEA
jgi:GNAT superfamily N-acetyltransferase